MDSHFNPDALLRSSAQWEATTEDYIGLPGIGRKQEYKGSPYCQGFGYAIRGTAMGPFATLANPPKLPPMIVNSDVAVGHVLGLVCKSDGHEQALIMNHFSVDEEGIVKARQLAGSGFGDSKQMALAMFSAPPTPMLMAILVHPIKSTAEYLHFHQQVTENLRPPLVGPSSLRRTTGVVMNVRDWKKYKDLYVEYWKGSCMANVAEQICRYREIRPPCHYRPGTARRFPLEEVSIVKVTDQGDGAETKANLEKAGLKVKVHPPAAKVEALAGLSEVLINGTMRTLTQDEVQYKRNTEMVMREWLAEHGDDLSESAEVSPVLAMIDNNAHCLRHLSSMYTKLDSYCLDGLSSGVGVLKLATFVDGQGTFPDLSSPKDIGGRHLIEYELSMTGSTCYSGHYATRGSVATIYSKGAVSLVLKWLSEHKSLPFDKVFPHLTQLGVPVRAMQHNACFPKTRQRRSMGH
jgi:hypothetical protein